MRGINWDTALAWLGLLLFVVVGMALSFGAAILGMVIVGAH